jgi:tetratricopeptide (TPR) repeat protein
MTRLLAAFVVTACSAAAFATLPPAAWADSADSANSAPVVPAPDIGSLKELLRAGKYPEVESRTRALLSSVEQSGGSESLAAADLRDILLECFWRQGKTDAEAIGLSERAVRIRETLQGREHLDLAKSLNQMANLRRVAGDFTGARPLFERTLAIREKALGPDHPDVAKSLNNLALVLWKTGDFAGARDLFQRVVAILEKVEGPDHADVAQGLNNLAVILHEIGDYAGALELQERAVGIREKSLGPDHPDLAQSFNNLANLLYSSGDFARARSYFDRAHTIWEASVGPRHPDLALSMVNQAVLLRETGDLAGARILCDRALAIQEGAAGGEHPELARTLTNLAIILRDTGDPDGALANCRRARAIYEKSLGPNHPDVGLSLSVEASILRDRGDLVTARSLYERGLAIQESGLGPDHPDVARSLDDLGGVLAAMGQPAKALALYERALRIQAKTLGLDHPDAARTFRNRGHALLASGDFSGALESGLRAEEIRRAHLRLTTRSLAESQALRYAAVRLGGLDLALSILATQTLESQVPEHGAVRDVWDAEIRSRAVVLDEIAARHRTVVASSDPETAALWSAVQNARARLANLSVRGLEGMEPAQYRALLDRTALEMEEAERALAGRSEEFQSDLARSRVGIAEVLRALPRNAALVAYCRYEPPPGTGAVGRGNEVPGYLAFVARGGSLEVERVMIGDADPVEFLVKSWRREILLAAEAGEAGVTERAYRAAGEALRRRIWDPVSERLGDAGIVFVVPDGALQFVSFAALPVGEGGYLVEEDPILHYLSAEKDLLHEAGRVNTGLFTVGDPDFDKAGGVVPEVLSVIGLYRGASSGCADLETLEFERLPSTRQETKDVVRLWKKSRRDEEAVSLLGPMAAEGRVKSGMRGKRVVHLATHAFLLGDSCATAPSNGISPPAAESPLLRSGLALAGANRKDLAAPEDEDGILTAQEIASLDLRGVEWAVLSACGTGLGRLRSGEGVLGLRRAFETAGVGTLIMSLWPVEDDATRSWMRALYAARLESGRSTAEAVSLASRGILAERRSRGLSTHPCDWAAFIAAGDWR